MKTDKTTVLKHREEIFPSGPTCAVKTKLCLGAGVRGCSQAVLHVGFLALTEILRRVVGDVGEFGEVESCTFLTALVGAGYGASNRGDITGSSGDFLHIGRGVGYPVRWILIDIIRNWRSCRGGWYVATVHWWTEEQC